MIIYRIISINNFDEYYCPLLIDPVSRDRWPIGCQLGANRTPIGVRLYYDRAPIGVRFGSDHGQNGIFNRP